MKLSTLILATCLGFLIYPLPIHSADTQSLRTCFVYKPDGTRHCESHAGVSLDAMALELAGAGISVFSTRKGYDGREGIAICGYIHESRGCVIPNTKPLGDGCAVDDECFDDAVCCKGSCSTCCDNADCDEETSCEQIVVGYELLPFVPYQCAPGQALYEDGEPCFRDSDCSSDACFGYDDLSTSAIVGIAYGVCGTIKEL